MVKQLLVAMMLGGAIAMATPASAATVWSSTPADITFTKLTDGDATLAANQDRITANVWLTRGTTKALFNAVNETFFNDSVDPAVSPADTEWAFSGVGGNPAFAYGSGAAAYSSLTFTTFEDSLGGQHALASNILADAGVLHLITDDIYIDIQFTSWEAHGGGAFSYVRAAAPVPEPASLGVLALAAGGLLRRRRRV